MKKKFKVGDRVRVNTRDYGDDQYGDVGEVINVNADSWLPVRVKFDPGSNAAENSYSHEDLVLEKAPKAKKPTKPSQAYKGNGKHYWEGVVGDTMRLRVPGGYIYQNEHSWAVFVPMPEVVKHKV